MRNFKNLQQYSLFSAAFLLIKGKASSEVVYTDIDPDVTIQNNGETYFIDMDNNGTIDFDFLKTSGSYYFWNGSSSTWRYVEGIWAGPNYFENEIAGYNVTHGAGGGVSYFPDGLNFGELVANSLYFQNWGFQIMAKGYKLIGNSGDTIWDDVIGKWAPDINNKYLGVRFYDEVACLHYGWIRCSSEDSTNVLRIQDFAYETECDRPILAGDTISYVEIEEENDMNATIYSFDNIIHLQFPRQPESGYLTEVIDVFGEVVYNGNFTSKTQTIELDVTPGIYFVKISCGNLLSVKKIYLQ